jgi:hypothetical protein
MSELIIAEALPLLSVPMAEATVQLFLDYTFFVKVRQRCQVNTMGLTNIER